MKYQALFSSKDKKYKYKLKKIKVSSAAILPGSLRVNSTEKALQEDSCQTLPTENKFCSGLCNSSSEMYDIFRKVLQETHELFSDFFLLFYYSLLLYNGKQHLWLFFDTCKTQTITYVRKELIRSVSI